ncbi:MAG: glycosyltransferase [Verrucomicrobiota bacterium]
MPESIWRHVAQDSPGFQVAKRGIIPNFSNILPPHLSVIIPCLNETERLRRLLERFRSFTNSAELIIADASHRDLRRINALAARQLRARHLSLPRAGRGFQMREGAAVASGDILLFQHIDVDFRAAHFTSLLRAFEEDKDLVGGGFHKALDRHYPEMSWAKPFVTFWEQQIGVLYGDQSVFVRRSHYDRIGGIQDMPLMEDMEFSNRLRASGKVRLLEPPLFASMRRFREDGVLKRKLLNWLTIQLYRAGASPDWLYRFYYRRPPNSPSEA